MTLANATLMRVAPISILCLYAAACGGGETQPEPSQADAAPAPVAESAPPPAGAEPAPATLQRGDAIGAAANALAGLSGDPARGKRVFVKCMACHSAVPGQIMTGPSLYDVIGRSAGQSENFTRYSKAMVESGIIWSEEALFAYLADPAGFVPGNGMIFPGLPVEQDRADVIAYLKSLSQSD